MCPCCVVFYINHTLTTEFYTLSLHDALPIFGPEGVGSADRFELRGEGVPQGAVLLVARSEEHTSELQSLRHIVCRLLLEKKKSIHLYHNIVKFISIHCVTHVRYGLSNHIVCK